jgi:glycosyltransferase involved in cell wall biosynthesis
MRLVTVVVPVFGAAQELHRTVEGLSRQTYPRDKYEVIVVDNGCDPPCAPAAHPDLVRLIREEKPGSYAARNAGIRASTAEILGFVDAGCTPRPDWIERAVERLTNASGPMVLGGHLDPAVPPVRTPTVIEWYDSLTYYDQSLFTRYGFASTANLFTWRRVLDDVGLFEESIKSGADSLFGIRAAERGYPVTYAPDVTVIHPPLADLRSFIRRHRRIAGGIHDKERLGLPCVRISLSTDLLFAFRALPWIITDRRLSGVGERAAFFLMVFFQRVIRLCERIRLRWGGLSLR